MKSILIRADGSFEIGMGHISRMITISNYLSTNYLIYFVTVDNPKTRKFLENIRFPVTWLNLNMETQHTQMFELIENNNIELVINDIIDIKENYLKCLKKDFPNLKIINYEDVHCGYNQYCDVIINPLAFLRERLTKEKTRHYQYLNDLDYFIFPQDLQTSKNKVVSEKIKEILIFMGGADTRHITLKVLKILCSQDLSFYNITVLLGPFMDKFDILEVKKYKTKIPHLKVFHEVPEVISFYENTDLCFCAGGNVLLELIKSGVPTISVAAEEHEDIQCKYFSNKGLTLYGGYYQNINPVFLLDKFNKSNDPILRKEIKTRSLSLFKSDGLPQIKKIINHLLLVD
ncbi:MAG: hypothetical protein HQ490_05690 [Lutibacter sp.]|nr:hypothetical protein [Lutibacter sp.]